MTDEVVCDIDDTSHLGDVTDQVSGFVFQYRASQSGTTFFDVHLH